jgi:hypothetical protein
MADGTAQKCGRVGSCHIYLKSLSVKIEGLFCALNYELMVRGSKDYRLMR